MINAGLTFTAATSSLPPMPHLKHFASLLQAVTLLLAALAAAPAAHALGGEQGMLQVPYISEDAVVTGEAGAALQATLAAEGSGLRKLLHGRHRPVTSFPRCPRCRNVSCRARVCAGHCRRGTKLFTCTSNRPQPPAPSASPSRSRGRSSSRRSE